MEGGPGHLRRQYEAAAPQNDPLQTADSLHLTTQVFENLRQLTPAPNVQMHHAQPDAPMADADDDDEPDSRISRQQADRQVQHGAEFYDGAKGE